MSNSDTRRAGSVRRKVSCPSGTLVPSKFPSKWIVISTITSLFEGLNSRRYSVTASSWPVCGLNPAPNAHELYASSENTVPAPSSKMSVGSDIATGSVEEYTMA